MPEQLRLDHVVIHVSEWARSLQFYRAVLGAEVVANEESASNPAGSWVFRFGEQQVNVHGPWPGRDAGSCCPAPLNKPGTADLSFVWPGTTQSVLAHLRSCGLEAHEGPSPRFGARGWGSSVYVLDPDGNSIELITYATAAE